MFPAALTGQAVDVFRSHSSQNDLNWNPNGYKLLKCSLVPVFFSCTITLTCRAVGSSSGVTQPVCSVIIIIISKLLKLSAANALVDYKHSGLFLCRQAGICIWHNN